jgi:hypothetical protein
LTTSKTTKLSGLLDGQELDSRNSTVYKFLCSFINVCVKFVSVDLIFVFYMHKNSMVCRSCYQYVLK